MQNIIVNMKFNADVEQAKKQMQSLQNSLNQVMNMSTNSMGKNYSQVLVQDLQKGQQAAAQLQVALRAAFNEKTGKMDLSKFNQSMQQSGMTIQKYKAQLSALGPTGQQAFTKLAQSVASAEIPVLRISDGMRRLATTFANTARYQLSASLISGFTKGISQAFTYAKDLNESLNNIRIVTGYGTDQMKEFAKQANKAAKELSTTTTAYTDASLIFYQQGLSGDAVKERTDVVVKLANVTGQSVQVVSDQMTAIWNNFDDGSKSMEYYADVITKLGAATASSTDEISDGLEKFAAVSETVGLSYEMATAALATVTAETRQSADVVGTAFKTIFSRMEGLKLGETLEDGTTLNQYSQALATVGVNIKDQNGQMREMDDILTDLGAKWQTLGKDQQIALAQSVAGVRQYNQFIALMGNWDKVQENLDVAINSTGELNAQSEIYEESWEAASNRVKASLEGIYDSLINDEFIIKITDFAAKFLSTIENIIDSMGGFKGVALMLGTVLTRVFSTQITTGITNLQYSLMGLTARGRDALNTLKQDTIQELGGVHANAHGKVIGGIQGNIDKGSMEMADMVARSKTELNPEAQAVLSIFQQQAAALAEAAHHSAELAANQEEITKKTHVTGKSNEELEKTGVVREDVVDENGHKTGNITIDNIKEKGDKRVLRSIAEDAKEMHPGAKVSVGEFRSKDSDTRIDSLTLSKKTEKDLVADYEDKVKTKTAESVAMKKAQSGGYITGNDKLFDKSEEGQYYNQQEIISASQTASGFAAMGKEGLQQTFGEDGALAFQEYTAALEKAKKAGEGVVQAQGELATAAGKEKKAQQELNQVIEKLSAKKKKGKKLTEEEIKQDSAYIKAEAKLEKAKAKVAKATEKVGKAQQDASEEQGKAMAEAAKANDKFNAAAEESARVAGESGEKLEAMGYSSADAAEQGEKLGDAMYALGDDAAQAKISVDNAGDSMANMKTKTFTGVESLTTMASALMSVGMAISSAKGLWDTWNSSDTSFGDKLIATMITLGMVIPMVTTALNANNIAKMMGITLTEGATAAEVANTIATKGNVVAKGALKAVTAILAAVKRTETTAVWANNTAWYASPIMWIPLIIMAVIAAIALLIAKIIKLTNWIIKGNAIETENAERLKDLAKKTQELSKANDELVSGMDELIDKFKDQKAAGEDTYETLKEMKEQADQLSESYQELSDHLNLNLEGDIAKLNTLFAQGMLTGDFTAYEEQKQAIEETTTKAEGESIQEGLEGAAAILVSSLWDEQGSTSGNSYTLDVGGADGDGSGEEEKAQDILEEIMGDYYKESDSATKWGAELTISNYNDPQEVLDWYKKLDQARNKMLTDMNADQLEESDIFTEIDEILKAGAENYDELNTMINDNQDKIGEAINYEAGDIDKVNNYAQFETYYENFAKLAEEEYNWTQAEIDAWISKNGEASEYYNKLKLIKTLQEGGWTEKEAQSWVEEHVKDGYSQLKMQEWLDEQRDDNGKISSTALDSGRLVTQLKTIKEEGKKQQKTVVGNMLLKATSKEELNYDLIDTNNEIWKQLLLDKGYKDIGSVQGLSYDKQNALLQSYYSALLREETGIDVADYNKFQETQNKIMNVGGVEALEAAQGYQTSITSKNFSGMNYFEMTSHTQNTEKSNLEYSGYDDSIAAALLDKNSELDLTNVEAVKAAMEDLFENGFDVVRAGEFVTDENGNLVNATTHVDVSEDDPFIQGFLNRLELYDKAKKEEALTIDIDSEYKNKLEEIYEDINNLKDTRITIATDWEDVETLQKSFENATKLAQQLGNEIQENGNEYKFTKEQVKEYVQVFPELFTEARGTADGMISVQKSVVDNAIQGTEATVRAEAEKRIKILKMQEEQLLLDKAEIERKIELANDLAKGEINIKQFSLIDKKSLEDSYAEYDESLKFNEIQISELVTDQVVQDAADTAEAIVQSFLESGAAAEDYFTYVVQASQGNVDIANEALSQLKAKAADSAGAAVRGKNKSNSKLSELNSLFAEQDKAGEKADQELTSKDIEYYNWSQAWLKDLYAQLDSTNEALGNVGAKRATLESYLNSDISDWGADNSSDSSSSSNEKELKELEEIIDRYHELERELEQVNRKMEMASSSEERLKYMKEALALQERLHAANRVYLESDRLALQELFNNKLKFDADGEIENYSAVLDQLNAEKKKATDAYNKSSKDETAEDKYNKAIESIDERIEAIEQYEETLSETLDNAKEVYEQYNEYVRALAEERVEAFEEGNEALASQIDYLDKKIEDLEDETYAQAEIAALLGSSMGAALEQAERAQSEYKSAMDYYEDIKDGYDKFGKKISEDEIDAAWEDVQNAADAVSETTETIEDIQERLDELLLAHLEDQAEAFDKVSESLEHYNSVLENYKNILDLLGRNYQDDDLMRSIASNQVENAKVRASAAKAEFDLITAELEAAMQDPSVSQETIDEMKNQQREAQNELLEAWSAGLEAVAAEYEQNIEIIIKNAEKQLTKFYNLEEAQKAYDQQKSLNELHVEEYEKLYNLNKLTREINKSMSQIDSLGANRKLSDLLDEINKKKASGVKMSQYEVDTLEKKYQLRLAEIALEEAQNAKGSMRLQRDASGNWAYVYTTDQEKIDQAQQQYEDALYNLENASREHLDSMSELILQTQQETMERILEVRASDYDTTEEYYAAIQEIYDQQNEKIRYYYDQIGIAIGDINGAYGEQVLAFNDLVLAEVSGIETIEEGVAKFNTSVSGMLDEAKKAFETYQKGQEEITTAAGEDLDKLAGDMAKDIDDINGKTKEVKKTVGDLRKDAEGAFNGMLKAFQDFNKKYSSEANKVITENDKIEQSFLDILAAKEGVDNYVKSGNKKDDNKANSSGNNKTSSSGANNSGTSSGSQSSEQSAANAQKQAIATAAAEIVKKVYNGTISTNPSWPANAKKAGYSDAAIKKAKEAFNSASTGGNGDYDYQKALAAASKYNTGGYTGEWGPEGRLAILHEKELILNSQQTEDFLKSLEMMSRIINVIDRNTTLAAAAMAIGQPSTAAPNERVVQQTVSIDASFPGVTSAVEIEEALNSIVNDAVQYASMAGNREA